MSLSPDDLSSWRIRLNNSLDLQAGQKDRWETSLDFIRLRYFQKRQGDDPERVEVNLAWSYLNTLIPTLYSRDPEIKVKPRRARSTPFANTMADVLMYQRDELKLKDCVQRATGDTVPTGIGWAEVGYQPFKENIQEFDKAQRKPSPAQVLSRTLKDTIRQITGQKSDAQQMTAPGQLLPEIREGEVYLRWRPFWSVLLAPGYHLIREMPYLIAVDDLEIEELANDPRYPEDKLRRIRPTRQLSSPNRMMKTNQPSFGAGGMKPIQVVRRYTIWDRRGDQVIHMVEGLEEELFHEQWPMAFDEFPFVPLIFNDTPPDDQDSNAYPMDDITPVKSLLMEKSMLRSSMIKARRRSAPLILVDKNILNEDEIRNLTESEEVNIVPVSSTTAVVPMQPVRLPDDIYKIDSTIDNDFYLVTGFNQLMQAGASPSSNNTATEANLAQAGVNLRVSRRVNIIEDFIVEIARRMAALSWEKYDRTTIADILGRTDITPEMWPDLPESIAERRRIIRRELDFKIEAGSTQPEQTRLIEMNLWIRNVNMIAAAFPDEINREKLLEQHLKKMGMKEIEYIIKGSGEQERSAAQMENQLLLQGIPQIVSPNERHDIHIATHTEATQMGGTEQLDQHILAHNAFRIQQNPAAKSAQAPQQGDSTSPHQAAVPELQRGGGANIADISGQGQRMSEGLGPETSMSS